MNQTQRQARARLAIGILVISITVVLVYSDWPADITAGFWTKHSLASGIASGLVLFLFAAFVVDRWIAWRERNKTLQVKEVAHKVLAHVMRQEGQYLHAITSGRRPLRSPLVPVDQSLVKRCVKATRRIVEEQGDGDLIRALCDDREWREAAHLMVRDLRLSSTLAISQWAPVMMQTSDLAERFNRVAGAIDALSPVQRLLNDAREKRKDPKARVRDGVNWPDQLAKELENAQVLSVATQEWLNRSIDDAPEFQSRQREWLSPPALQRLEAPAE